MPTRLIISESERGADMFYATRFRAPDPFVYLEHRGKKSLLLSDLEIDRGRREAQVDTVFSFSDLQNELKLRLNHIPCSEEVIAAFVKQQGARRVLVPRDFPLGMACDLKKWGITTTPVKADFFAERAIKTTQEVGALKHALKITEVGMARAHEILKSSTIKKNLRLEWARQPLTSELLRCEIEIAILRAGGIPAGDSIVAGGQQACDPHERGHGPLRANELIVIDLFPRDGKSGYYGDLTRTVVRGKASSAQRHLWETCLAGQEQVLKSLKPGASGKKIHQALQDFFTREGYPTEQKKGRWSGFFHGTGHGLGLEIHDSLRFGKTILKPGHVFTIEPGLYIPGLGGVRHEDVVVITEKGYRLLSKFPKMLEV
ncbi:MAG: Xaa-Pro peptidase family protein [Chthoniobacterales bacterium]|nr:Xaa-Pro peptidase family protein [Chthoniobacterales bacterium]